MDEFDVDQWLEEADKKATHDIETKMQKRVQSEMERRPILRRLVETSSKIQLDTPTMREADFLHSILCQVGMPRKQTEAREFERASGNVRMVLEAGRLWDGQDWVKKPLPYGAIPRLIMVHVSSQAIKTGNPRVEIGDSVREFMLRLGIEPRGGPRGGYTMFRKQMEALAACRLFLGITPKDGSPPITINTQPISEFQAWLTNDEERTPGLWKGELELSEKFFNTLKEHAVPLDTRALGVLKHSSLALDIYTWLAYRLCQITRPEGVRVTWYALKDQFGQEYKEVKDFRKEFRQALKQVLAEYPQARVSEEIGGILLKESPPPIRKAQFQVVHFDPKNPENKIVEPQHILT